MILLEIVHGSFDTTFHLARWVGINWAELWSRQTFQLSLCSKLCDILSKTESNSKLHILLNERYSVHIHFNLQFTSLLILCDFLFAYFDSFKCSAKKMWMYWSSLFVSSENEDIVSEVEANKKICWFYILNEYWIIIISNKLFWKYSSYIHSSYRLIINY